VTSKIHFFAYSEWRMKGLSGISMFAVGILRKLPTGYPFPPPAPFKNS
jgi:hypothetical protein